MDRVRIYLYALFLFVFVGVCVSFVTWMALGTIFELLEPAGWPDDATGREFSIWIWLLVPIIVGLAFGWRYAQREYRDLDRARTDAKGLCDRCGYDLRESHDRCPECGAVIRLKRRIKRE